MAPPGKHLVVAGGRACDLTSDPQRHSCRPSVDVLFESIAREMGAVTIAALLTGMGRDGATGLLGIRRAGGATIAQDEATSTVYGMPREAALIGAAEQILPIQDIGPAIALAAGAAHGTGAPMTEASDVIDVVDVTGTPDTRRAVRRLPRRETGAAVRAARCSSSTTA